MCTMDLMVIGCTWSTMGLVVDSCTVYNGLDGDWLYMEYIGFGG